jgi:hypothetical protein
MNRATSGTRADQTNAIVTGALFITATVTAIIGLKLYNPILNHPDYLTLGTRSATQITLGVVFELILVAANTGTGVMLFPYLRKFNESLGLGYLSFRLLEVMLILVGIISILALLTLSHSYTHVVAPDVATYHTIGAVLKAVHNWTFMLGPNFMLGINTFIYSYVFYQSGLLPRFLAVTGMLGALLVFIAALLEMFGIIQQLSAWGVLLALPIFAYEMILAIWLIRRGFNLASLMPQQSTADSPQSRLAH